MPADLPPSIQPLLDAYLNALNQELPGLVTAVYLHGSIALDAFDPHFSDVDIVAVLDHRPV